jgi:hypothetical protein
MYRLNSCLKEAGMGRQGRRWEAEYYKFGSDHTGTLTFVEELFYCMTSQIYHCKNGRILET